MSVKFIEEYNDIISRSIPKEISQYGTQEKTMEDSNIEKNENKNINNILDPLTKEKENGDNKIFQLKKELHLMNSQKDLIALEKIKNYSYNGFQQNMANNNINYLTSYMPLVYKQINDIIEKEYQYNKSLQTGLKFLSNINNKNNYLLKFLVPNYFSQNSIFNQKINYNITIQNKLNENQFRKKINNNKNNFISESKNENNNIKINLNNKPNINFIDINLILKGEENRTVVRLHPIPQNYSSFDISKLIDKYLHIESGKNQRIYKALYVPLSKILGKNIGFCFIMMVKPKYVINFYTTFNGINFNKKKARKPCSVIWADMQGDDFLKISEDPLRSPIIFKDLIIN